MSEKPLTKKITKIIKTADKLIQDVQKGIGQIIAGVNELKEMRGKSKDEQNK